MGNDRDRAGAVTVAEARGVTRRILLAAMLVVGVSLAVGSVVLFKVRYFSSATLDQGLPNGYYVGCDGPDDRCPWGTCKAAYHKVGFGSTMWVGLCTSRTPYYYPGLMNPPW